MDDLLVLGFHVPQNQPKKYRERMLTINDLTDRELRARYRFGRAGLEFITDIVRADIEHPTKRSKALSPEMQVLIALRYYATGSFMQVVGDTVGVDKSTVSRCITRVSTVLASKAGDFIEWPSEDRKREIKNGYYENGGFPGVIGCIDGTHARIQAPAQDEPSFVNRKGYHSINVQAICDHEGRFTNLVARWPGSVHDSHILRCSKILEHLELTHKRVEDGIVLGDSGYGCKSFLMTPFMRPTEDCHERFNRAHTKTRCCIERTFGWWKKRFNCLHSGVRVHPEKACTMIMACAVLHNIAINLKEPMDDADEVDDSCIDIPFRGPEEGRTVRDHICRAFFS